jgi:hypothetical protein
MNERYWRALGIIALGVVFNIIGLTEPMDGVMAAAVGIVVKKKKHETLFHQFPFAIRVFLGTI